MLFSVNLNQFRSKLWGSVAYGGFIIHAYQIFDQQEDGLEAVCCDWLFTWQTTDDIDCPEHSKQQKNFGVNFEVLKKEDIQPSLTRELPTTIRRHRMTR